MKMRPRCLIGLLFLLFVYTGSPQAQDLPTKFDIDRARLMLSTIKDDVKKNYYDPTFHGMDLDARFKTADEKIKTSSSIGQMFSAIAQALMDLRDSHTFFLPPSFSSRTEYGWQAQAIGDRIFVTSVKPKSDAEGKGLKARDEILSVDGIRLSRQNMWVFQYVYHLLRPRDQVSLVVTKPDGKQQPLDLMANVRQEKRVTDLTGNDLWDFIRESENESRLRSHRYLQLSENAFVWKMPAFDLEKDKVDSMCEKFRKSKGLILDLRGNGGGLEEALLELLGNLFDHDVKVGEV